ARERGDRDRRVVDHPVDDHVGDGVGGFDVLAGDLGDLPRELVLAGEVLVAAVSAYGVDLHAVRSIDGVVWPVSAVSRMLPRLRCRCTRVALRASSAS